ncbi:MAG: hypothetical protein ABIN58_03055, partial [candidate division WOR-3 bacterium]
MTTLTRLGIRWKGCERSRLGLVMVCLLAFGGTGRDSNLNLAQPARASDGLGSEQSLPAVVMLGIDPSEPTTLYAGVRGAGVFKSSDDGASWQAVNAGLPTNAAVQALAVHPTTPATLYVGTDRGVFKSTDGGKNWRAANLSRAVTTLAIDPQTPSRLYVGTCNGVFKSDNEGQSWTAINSGLTRMSFSGLEVFPFLTSLVIDPVSPSILYVGAIESVYKTNDEGASWRSVYVGASTPEIPGFPSLSLSGVTALIIDPITPATLYIGITGSGEASGGRCGLSWNGLTGGIIKSGDGGTTWNK